MKKEYLFTPEQKQYFIQDECYIGCKFGKFMSSNGFLDSWTQSNINSFKGKFQNKPIINKGKQLGILFAYNIAIKNVDYFIQNRTYDFARYFSKKTTKGWNGFAYYIFEQLQKMESEQDVREFFEILYNKIFD